MLPRPLEARFHSPVARYQDLKLDSTPLTRTLALGGRSIAVEVKLVHPGMVADPAFRAAAV